MVNTLFLSLVRHFVCFENHHRCGDHVMVGDVDHCFRFFQNWHTPKLYNDAPYYKRSEQRERFLDSRLRTSSPKNLDIRNVYTFIKIRAPCENNQTISWLQILLHLINSAILGQSSVNHAMHSLCSLKKFIFITK